MIASLSGKIIHKDNRSFILAVGGIGYKITATPKTLSKLKKGDRGFIWTHLSIREDSQNLFGFLKKEELDFFELLITVSGIGPRTALAILSVASPDVLKRAISSSDTSYLTKVSGLGKKKADKIVLELKDKIGSFEINVETPNEDVDVIEALKALGYQSGEAREAVKKIGDKIKGAGERIKAALRILSQ
jgi:Holliday junction DNA helicase RuvA